MQKVELSGDAGGPMHVKLSFQEELAQVAHNLAALSPEQLIAIGHAGGMNMGDRVSHTNGAASNGRLAE